MKIKSDLIVCLSTVSKLPNEKDNEQRKLNPARMIVSSGDYDPSFREPFLYLAMKSDRGAQVIVSAMFPNIKSIHTRGPKMINLPTVR